MINQSLKRFFSSPLQQSNNNFSIAGGITNYVSIVLQLVALLGVIYLFKIEEGHGLLLILIPLFIGFIIHSFLPVELRLPFFLILSIVTYGIVIGIGNTLIIVGIGLLLISLVHLPINYWLRVLLVVIAAIILGLLRVEIIPSSWGALAIPIIGSIFMFRLILYIYELSQKPVESNLWQKLTYFFMLPNVLFPLFPIVDFKTYLKTYYDVKANDIYQKGVNWMFRGVIHLLLYKIVYYYFSPSIADIVDVKTLIIYILSNYSLLFRISGQSHLIIGMLALFGFNLPQIFNKYFLASGFNDFWRRINIYWKDFVMKIFYYPIYFVFKRWGMTVATVITLLIIFFITWMLHSYQWFWIQGVFPITLVDGLFWGIFGVLIVINSVLQTKKTKKKALGERSWNISSAFIQSLKVVTMFTFMCFLWTLWMSSSLTEWVSVMSGFTEASLNEIIFVIVGWILAVIIGVISQYVIYHYKNFSFYKNIFVSPKAVTTGIAISLLLIIGLNHLYLPNKTKIRKIITTLQENKLNSKDSEIQERGYYEPILKGNQLTSDLLSTDQTAPPDWVPLYESEASQKTSDLFAYTLVPSKKTKFKNSMLSTNQWGMRDKEYGKVKPEDVYRFAILGSSLVMGSGVEDDEVFENIVENRLNTDLSPLSGKKYELLNFAVGGYHIMQSVKFSEEIIFEFNPEVVFYFAHPREDRRAMDRSIKLFEEGTDLEYDFLRQIKKDAGCENGMNHSDLKRRLLPYGKKIIEWGYKTIVANCLKNNAIPVWVYLPTIDGIENESKEEISKITKLAQDAGFKIISLAEVFKNYDIRTIQVAPWDNHPNALGHRLIADLFYKRLIENQKEIGF